MSLQMLENQRMGRPAGPTICSMPDCDREGPTVRGLCARHYKAAWKRGEYGSRERATERTCDTCLVEKPISAFHARSRHRSNHTTCAVCRRAAGRKRHYQSNSRDWQLQRTYGITQAEYDEMVRQQNGLCAICHRPPGKKSLHVDHDHDTGRIRGLLCRGCNMGLGGFRDDPIAMLRAAGYVMADADLLASLSQEA